MKVIIKCQVEDGKVTDDIDKLKLISLNCKGFEKELIDKRIKELENRSVTE